MVERGDRYVYQIGKSPPLFILVKRVSKTQKWADIAVCTWAILWTKRMDLPFPDKGFRREDWTLDDVNEWIPA